MSEAPNRTGNADHARHADPTPCAFPFLPPELPIVWRDDTTIQIGLDPTWARCIPHASRREYTHLTQLDGTRSFDRVIKAFEADQGDGAWFANLIGDLVAHGIVISRPPSHDDAIPAPEIARLAPDQTAWSLARPGVRTMARRQSSLVHVRGTGRVGVGVSTLLTSAGIGSVRISPFAGDAPHVGPSAIAPLGPSPSALGAPSRAAVRDALFRTVFAASNAKTARAQEPDLTVLCPPRAIAPATAQLLSATTTPHLVVLADGPLARVGPLVVPGITPCLHCLDLHRADRDPQWPLVLTQVANARGTHRTATDSVLATLAAATAVTHVLALIDDPNGSLPPSAGALLDLRVPSLTWQQRRWPAHPQCGCQWTPDPGEHASNAARVA